MGCDVCYRNAYGFVKSFNPRTHMGCDESYNNVKDVHDVSIHAPTWGATKEQVDELLVKYGFNPRTHMGCDPNGIDIYAIIHRFQSTHPHGVRRFFAKPLVIVITRFNPRTHMGCDYLFRNDGTQNLFVSIHAPTWGATPRQNCYVPELPFQSTHPHGVRHRACFSFRYISGFNPRTHMGCDINNIINIF